MKDDTESAINDPSIAAGLALTVGALMDKFGLTEFVMDPEEFPIERLPMISIARTTSNKLIVRLNEGE